MISIDKPDVSWELARQLEFDACVIFGLWGLVTDNPRALFKNMDEALRILRMEANQLLRVRYVHVLDAATQQMVLVDSLQIVNLTGEQVSSVAKLRRDVE